MHVWLGVALHMYLPYASPSCCLLTLAVAPAQSVEVMTCAEASAQADCEKITTCSWRVPNATELAAIREFMASMPESEVSGASLAQGGPSSRDTPTVIDPPAQDPAPDVEEEQLAPENLPIRETGECLPKDMTIVDYAKEVRCPGMIQTALST